MDANPPRQRSIANWPGVVDTAPAAFNESDTDSSHVSRAERDSTVEKSGAGIGPDASVAINAEIPDTVGGGGKRSELYAPVIHASRMENRRLGVPCEC